MNWIDRMANINFKDPMDWNEQIDWNDRMYWTYAMVQMDWMNWIDSVDGGRAWTI